MRELNYINGRNYGIDLLRVLSMFYVVILHTLYHGGVLDGALEGTSQYKTAWALEIVAYCAVDIFALISGYVSKDSSKTVKYSKYLYLWVEVVFYGLACLLFAGIINPTVINYNNFAQAIMPITTKQYWYFTAYTGLFIMMPALNSYVNSCDKESLKRMFYLLIAVFIIYDNTIKGFGFNNGYSVIHLIICYLLGKIIRKCDIGVSTKPYRLVAAIIMLYIITWLWRIYGWEGEILTVRIDKELFAAYTSPTILIASVFYLILFSRIKLPSIMLKIVYILTPYIFAVYLINDNNILRETIIKGRFSYLLNESPLKITMTTISFSLIFVATSLAVDMLRLYLFEKIHVKEFAERVECRARETYSRLLNQ